MTEELTATLLVGAYTSRCSQCKQGAAISDTHHSQIISPGRTDPNARPCGARFTEINSAQHGDPERLTATLRALRPDLPIGQLPGTE